jgi:hypothetical protein
MCLFCFSTPSKLLLPALLSVCYQLPLPAMASQQSIIKLRLVILGLSCEDTGDIHIRQNLTLWGIQKGAGLGPALWCPQERASAASLGLAGSSRPQYSCTSAISGFPCPRSGSYKLLGSYTRLRAGQSDDCAASYNEKYARLGLAVDA